MVKHDKINYFKVAFITFSLLLMNVSLASIASAGTNLVLNPSFESGKTIPFNWSFVTQNGNTPVWDIRSHNGSRSVKIRVSGTTNRISGYPQSDLIPVQPLTSYVISVWGKTENAGGSNTPAVRVVELDANKKSLRQINLPVFSKGTNRWTQKTLQYKTESTTKYIYIYANIWNGYGTFWMDDVELRLKNTSTPTVTTTPVLTFTDDFNSLDTAIWSKEYSYPTVSDGFARFNLNSGTLNTATTWSKLSYKDKMFGYGTYSMTFKYVNNGIKFPKFSGLNFPTHL